MTENTDFNSAHALIQEKVASLNQVRLDTVKVIRDNFKDLFTEFFKKHPKAEKIGWVQYTPYFNDGDTCEFGVNDFGFRVEDDEDADDSMYWGKYRGGYRYEYDANDRYTRVEGFTQEEIDMGYTKEMVEDFKRLSKALRDIPDALYEDLFGDHAKITVTRHGVEVEELDHD